MPIDQPIAVVGAGGHTGRFVVAEIERRGHRAIRIGRNPATLAQGGGSYRIADPADPGSLDRALAGAAAVINCAGPFVDTALPVIAAAGRAQIPYLDVMAEQALALSLFGSDKAAGSVIVPGAAFFGGLADLLATAAAGNRPADSIDIAVGLDSWRPTAGTRLTGARNHAAKLVVADRRLVPIGSPPPAALWDFPGPLGRREVMMMSFSEIATIGSHLRADAIRSWINVEPIGDLRNPATPPPTAADPSGRSSQAFVVDVVVRSGDETRRATASGQDIYHISAPIVVEAAERLIRQPAAPGTRSLGSLFDAADYLESLQCAGLTLAFSNPQHSPFEKEDVHA